MFRISVIGFVLLTLIQLLIGCASNNASATEVRMEIPAYGQNDCIINYTGYTLSYNEYARIPVWTAYELTSDKTDGGIGRRGKYFQFDSNANVIQADNNDYRGSGWSRGHMAPAGDFKWNEKAMLDTFYYTNCCPQNKQLNNGSWNILENRVRKWANQYGRVYVVTGPIIGLNFYGKIGSHQIVVPDAFFKALLVRSDDGYQGVAFVMYNNSTRQSLSESYMSINELEKMSGLDFFPGLDDTIEETVEDEVNLKFWNIQ